MSPTHDKRRGLEALRRRLSPPDNENADCGLPQPVRDGCIAPALFAHGLHDIFGETTTDCAAATAFAFLAVGQNRKLRKRALVYARLAGDEQQNGTVYGAGLDRLGPYPANICLVVAPNEKALLWAAEEAASCSALAAAIIAMPASEKLYGFTESRRLKLRQEKSGTPLFIVRSRPRDTSAATARWRVGFASSEGLRTPGSNVPLLGAPRFLVALDRYAGLPPLQ